MTTKFEEKIEKLSNELETARKECKKKGYHEFRDTTTYIATNKSNPLLDTVEQMCKNCLAHKSRPLNDKEIKGIHELIYHSNRPMTI